MDPPLSASQLQKQRLQYKQGNAQRYKEHEQRQIKADKQQTLERQTERVKHVRQFTESRPFLRHVLNRSWPDRHHDLLRRRIDKLHQGLAKYKMRKVSRKEEYAMNLSSNINDMEEDELGKGDHAGALDDEPINLGEDDTENTENDVDPTIGETGEDSLSSAYSDMGSDESDNDSLLTDYSSDFTETSGVEGEAAEFDDDEDNAGEDANSVITGTQINLHNNGTTPQLQRFYDCTPQEKTRILNDVYKKLRFI